MYLITCAWGNEIYDVTEVKACVLQFILAYKTEYKCMEIPETSKPAFSIKDHSAATDVSSKPSPP